MRASLLLGGVAAFTMAAIAVAQSDPAGRLERLDDMERAPPGYSGAQFHPSYDFPAVLSAEARPWEAIDFRASPEQYLDTVLQYVLEGQDRDRWDVAANSVRKWYHMPWMGPGGQGREYISGLTSERRSRPGELGAGQTACRQNWAVGFYNPAGGYALGRIWTAVAAGTATAPDLSGLPFPDGTVVAKALYTQADASEVPLLTGAPTIEANIVTDASPGDATCPAEVLNNRPAPRSPATMRLLQLDVAVRDSRAGPTGWVFGTFVYDGRLPGADPWSKVRPVGLMWGNDPGLSDAAAAAGVKPVEGVFLSDFGLGRDFGRGGRTNGPVDNPASSCLSCHSTAQTPSTAPMTPARNDPWSVAQCWFRNIASNQAFGRAPAGTSCGEVRSEKSLDYSLQLAVAVRNFRVIDSNARRTGLFGTKLFAPRARSVDEPVMIDGVKSYPVSRDETVVRQD